MKKFLLILLALLVWAVVFVSTMPLQFAVDKVQLPENLQLSHLRGSVWSGGAHVVYKQGSVKVLPKTIPIDFVWRWCPRWENGLLAVCTEINNPDFKVQGIISYSPWSNRLLLRDTDLSFALAYLNLSIPVMNKMVKPKADARLSIQELWIDPMRGPSHGSMTGALQELELGFINLGDYALRSELENKRLVIHYAGQTDDFALNGDVRADFASRQYEYDADLLVDNAGYFDLLKSYAKSSQGKKLVFAGDGKLPF